MVGPRLYGWTVDLPNRAIKGSVVHVGFREVTDCTGCSFLSPLYTVGYGDDCRRASHGLAAGDYKTPATPNVDLLPAVLELLGRPGLDTMSKPHVCRVRGGWS